LQNDWERFLRATQAENRPRAMAPDDFLDEADLC